MPKFLSYRILKYGSNALVAVLIVLGILAVVNFLTTRYHARFDLTARGLYTLSPQTISLLENLSEDVNVVAFSEKQSSAITNICSSNTPIIRGVLRIGLSIPIGSRLRPGDIP